MLMVVKGRPTSAEPIMMWKDFSRNGITEGFQVVILFNIYARHKRSVDSCHGIFVLFGCLDPGFDDGGGVVDELSQAHSGMVLPRRLTAA